MGIASGSSFSPIGRRTRNGVADRKIEGNDDADEGNRVQRVLYHLTIQTNVADNAAAAKNS